MNVDEFFAWLQTEPDSYELIDGVPVRLPDEKQGGRRFGHLIRAAELAMGQDFWEWLSTKSPELGGIEPFFYVGKTGAISAQRCTCYAIRRMARG